MKDTKPQSTSKGALSLETNNNMCRVPVKATYRIIDGAPVMVSAEWADIPAEVIAEMIIRSFGRDPIRWEERTDN